MSRKRRPLQITAGRQSEYDSLLTQLPPGTYRLDVQYPNRELSHNNNNQATHVEKQPEPNSYNARVADLTNDVKAVNFARYIRQDIDPTNCTLVQKVNVLFALFDAYRNAGIFPPDLILDNFILNHEGENSYILRCIVLFI